MERITVDLISTKEFSSVSKGYDPKEVDEFLDDICDEMERMEAEIKDLQQKTTVVRPAAPSGVF
jgi:DivIVA domain-containing protein